MGHGSPKYPSRISLKIPQEYCLALAKASQGQCKVDQTTQEMGKGKEGEVVLFACYLHAAIPQNQLNHLMSLCR